MTIGTAGNRRRNVVNTSRNAAAAGEVIMPMRRGKGGGTFLRSRANKPSAASLALSFSNRSNSAPGPAHEFDVELKFSARLIQRRAGPHFDLHAVGERPVDILHAMPEHYAAHL